MGDFWRPLLQPNGNYTCPWCERELVSKKVQKEGSNKGRFFVSCSKDHEGCGLFCFLDEKPNEKFRPKNLKRARTGDDATASSTSANFTAAGTNLVGPLMNRPDAHEVRLAELAAAVDALRTQIAGHCDHLRRIDEYVKQVNE